MAPITPQTLRTVQRWLRGKPVGSRLIELDAKLLLAIVTDVRFHSRWVPFTRVRGPKRRIEVGESFTAITLGLRDRMTLTAIKDGVAHFRKEGPVFLGSAEISVQPVAAGVGRVTWAYDVALAGPLPQILARALAGLVLAPFVRIAIDRMEADILANKHRIKNQRAV